MARHLDGAGHFVAANWKKARKNLFIRIEVKAGFQTAAVEVRTRHNHIYRIEKNGELFSQPELATSTFGDKSQLTIQDILCFADEVRLEDVRDIIARQIACNSAISEEGLKNPLGEHTRRTHLLGSRLRRWWTTLRGGGGRFRMRV